MKADQVEAVIEEIRNKIDNRQNVNENDYADFKKEYPKIFSMCLTKDFNKVQMRFFLSKLKEIENNQTSEHDASVKIGTMLVNKYVKPHVKG